MEGDRPKGRSFEKFAVLPPYVMMLVCTLVYMAIAMGLAAPTAHALGWEGGALSYVLLSLLFAAPIVGCGVVLPTKLHVLHDSAISQEREERLLAEASRQEFEARLHRSLETTDREPEALEMVGRALDHAVPHLPAELLLADSSRAHLTVAVQRGPEGTGPGCPVDSPWSCPAVRRGQAIVTPSSSDLDACPKLWNRPGGACSAVCIPITVMGRAMGVLHATGDDGAVPDSAEVSRLETIATQAGSRIALLRAMERSQLQAATDPLTGLLNRRTLETRARDLVDAGDGFAVVVADLDNFKQLNDTFGHDAGDRALRLFSRVLTTSLRPEDIVCRYGGEEFVVVLPGADADAATMAMERIRESLALALASGTAPGFTASFGVTDRRMGSTLAELIEVADMALMDAKRTGRNRVVTDVGGGYVPA